MIWLTTLKRRVSDASRWLALEKSGAVGAVAGATPGRPPIDTEVDSAALSALLMHVENCWRRLCETEPHWSVLTDPPFKSDRIDETGPGFYASG